MNVLIRFFDQNNVGYEKVIALSILSNDYARKIKRIEGQRRRIGVFLTDSPEAFDCIDNNLLITKLSWYGVTHKSRKSIFSYLSYRTQQGVRLNNTYSRKSEVKYGVPQGSVLGPLLFNIDLIDLFLECEDGNITSYADETTRYSCAQDISSVISELQRIAKNIFDWCRNNHMKTNPEKCHVILSANIHKGKLALQMHQLQQV